MRLRPSPNTPASGPVREDRPAKRARVGDGEVRRLLPLIGRRSVGAWCFVDHFGPGPQKLGGGVGPHPHTGLQTVTWLIEGAMFHRDSLGSAQAIVPGQLNWMTAGRGIVHAEHSELPPGQTRATSHGVQLWVALPEAAREVEPSFEHYEALPRLTLPGAELTLMVGRYADARHEVRSFTQLFAAELLCTGGPLTLTLEPGFEHAAFVLESTGPVGLAGAPLERGVSRYLGLGRAQLELDAPAGARVLLIGGEPLHEQLLMWWNFVGRDDAEIRRWRAAWAAGDRELFGPVAGTALPRIDAPPLP